MKNSEHSMQQTFNTVYEDAWTLYEKQNYIHLKHLMYDVFVKNIGRIE